MHGWAYWWWNLDRASLFRHFLENMKHTVSIYRVYLPWDTYMFMIARVLLNLLIKLWKMIKCEFNKFNDTWASILDSFYNMTKKLLSKIYCLCWRSRLLDQHACTHIHTHVRAYACAYTQTHSMVRALLVISLLFSGLKFILDTFW